MRKRSLIPIIYILFLMLPIYWLVAMSFKTTGEILSGFSLFPQTFTFDNYRVIFTDPTWYWGYYNSILYVSLNTVISVSVALPAAYAFSRYRFLGDKQLFFWLLTNRMAPAAVFALPFFQLYSSVGLFDTHLAVALAHCLFNIPLAVWILEGFMGGVPKELDETAYVDGYSFPRFFISSVIGLVLIIFGPFLNLLRKPQTAIIFFAIFAGLIFFLQVLKHFHSLLHIELSLDFYQRYK